MKKTIKKRWENYGSGWESPLAETGVLKSWSIMTYPSDPIIVKLKGRKMQTGRQWREARSKGEVERAYGSASTTYDPKNLMLKMVMSHMGCGSIESDSSNSHYTTTIGWTLSHCKDMLQQVNTDTPVSKHHNTEVQTVYEKSSAHSLTQCSTFTNAHHFNSAEYAPRTIWTVGWVSPTVWT